MDTGRPALRQETVPSAKARVSPQMDAKLRRLRYLTIMAASLGMAPTCVSLRFAQYAQHGKLLSKSIPRHRHWRSCR